MKYINIVAQKLLERQNKIFETQKKSIRDASKLMASAWKNKNSVWVFSGAHSDIVTQELHFRAGGLVHLNPIYSPYTEFCVRPLTIMWEAERLPNLIRFEWSREPFNKGDVMILYSPAGCSALIVEAAQLCHEMGMKVIGITNVALSKQSEVSSVDGKRLFEESDIVIDTCGDENYGILSLSNQERLCSGENMMGIYTAQSLIVAAATELVNEGIEPPILRSVNRENAAQYNSDLIQKYKNSIHYRVMQGRYSNYYQVKN